MSVVEAYLRFVENMMAVAEIAEAVRMAEGLGVEMRMELLDRLSGALDDVLRRANAPETPGAPEWRKVDQYDL